MAGAFRLNGAPVEELAMEQIGPETNEGEMGLGKEGLPECGQWLRVHERPPVVVGEAWSGPF